MLRNLLSRAVKSAQKYHVSVERKPSSLLRHPEQELKPSLALLMAHFAREQEEICLVQLGANDGSLQDPVAPLVRQYNCRALLIDPQPDVFLKLQENYAGVPNVQLVNVALSSHDGTQTLYRISQNANAPEWASGLASFDKTHILKHEAQIPNIAQFLEEIEVPCRTFETLFHEYGISRVDVLQSDTEGFDFEIIKMFDVPRRLPAIINFEHSHLSSQDWDTATGILLDAGYSVAKVGQDTLAYRHLA